MGDHVVAEIADRCVGAVAGPASLREHTTLKVGGDARVLVTAEADADLAVVAEVAEREHLDVLVVGRGSNLLVADAGWPGIAVTLGRTFRGFDVDGAVVRAGASEPLPALAMRVANAGLGGFAWAAAVPGTLGGAVRMNAGAHGGEMSEALVEVEVYRLATRSREIWPVDTLGLRYRHSDLPDDAVVVGATLRLNPADSDTLRREITEIRQWRRDHQPLNEPNCGSVFTNPPGDSAGRLVDAAGGKGLRIGGAQISPQHANFIVTTPEATAHDVRRLIARVQQLVAEHAGVELSTEVVMRGEFDAPGVSG